MKKKNVINLIKYYTEGNDFQFKNEAIVIARYFDSIGDFQLAEYIMSLISEGGSFVPQVNEFEESFFRKVKLTNDPLPLPEEIMIDIQGILNAINRNVGVSKFLFEGPPGTGKTETVKQIARLLERQLYIVDFNTLIDSKMGQTGKNIAAVFKEINEMAHPGNTIILFDELDAIALDRVNSNDIREMGRATSAILKELDGLNDRVVLIATTNLYKKLDKALTRRFDAVINFDRYTRDDLISIAESILNTLLKKFKLAGRDIKLFRKILINIAKLPYPGDLKNIIKGALAFADPQENFDYLRRIFRELNQVREITVHDLHEKGFTFREIELLTGVSKSQVGRKVKENDADE